MRDRLVSAVLFGLRTAASGMLALYIAFALQIDQPGWAGTSAIIVAQPVLGAALRKGSFRLIGTLVGAVFSVLLYAGAPQDRIWILGGLALWGGACSFVSTFLREFAAYGAMLAGYTAAIVAMDAVSSPQDVFLLAVARGSAIAIGIVCTTLVFSLTDMGRQRAVLATRMAAIAAQTLGGLKGLLGEDPEPLDQQRERRRALVAQVAALDTVVDQAVGENFDLRARAGRLRAAPNALFTALSCWRVLEQHVRTLGPAARPRIAALRDRVAALLPGSDDPEPWRSAGAALCAEPVGTASERLLADQFGEALLALAQVNEGVVLLRDPRRASSTASVRDLQASDPLAALVNAARAVAVVGAAELFWVATGWSSGPVFVTFVMVVVMLFVLRDEAAFTGAAVMAGSCATALAAAAIIKFAALPLVQSLGLDGYATFVAVVGGVVFVFATVSAALPAGTTLSALALATLANFMPLFSATNSVQYDYAGFWNTALGILAGATFGAAGYRWLPPLAPSWRIRRGLDGTRRDLRRLLGGRWRPDEHGWARRLYMRLVQLPPQATLQQHAQVLAALSVGREVLRCRRLRSRAPLGPEDAMRLQAAQREIGEAVASHPQYLSGLGL